MSEAPRVAIVTFATTINEKPFNDYSHQIDLLRENANKFDIDFFSYNFSDLKVWIENTPFEKYPYFRRGVGGWFWKPIVILNFLEQCDYDFVVYMDVDCALRKSPIEVISSIPSEDDLAGFKMLAPIQAWTSMRVIKRLRAVEISANNMWTAGILIVRNSRKSQDSLRIWLNEMANPLNLFDLPFEPDGKKHRHDQSLLSILVAQKRITIFDLGTGFYSDGIEATSKLVENAWITTGIASAHSDIPERTSILARVRNRANYSKVRISILTFWFHYFFSFRSKRIR